MNARPRPDVNTRVDVARCAARRLAETLRTAQCPGDHLFDRFLPEALRVVSPEYWSPLVVAKRAAEWLDEVGVQTVVDVGSGAGKFCVAGALFGRCHFIGLEQREFLVHSARVLARVFQVDDRVRFVCAALGAVPTPAADAYYMFNPFGPYWFGSDVTEIAIEFSSQRVADDVATAERLLRRAPVRTWLLTYNGFGGCVPQDYELIRVDWEMPAPLRLWRKVRNSRD